MRKNSLKTLFLTATMAVGMTAQAQTDVTSQYIVNPGFEDCTPSEGNLATSKDGLGVDYSDSGWTFLYDQQAETWSMSAVFAYGSDGQINGAPIPAADNAGNSGNALGISVGWSHAFYYQSTNPITLPAGHYDLKVYAYNANNGAQNFKSLLGFVPTEGTAILSKKTSFTSGEWVTDVVSFDITEPTEGKFQIGGQAISGGSGANAKIFFDNITLTLTDFLEAAKDALQAEIDKANAMADIYKNADEDALSQLNQAISNASAALNATTVSEINDATTALQAAENEFKLSIRVAYDGVAYIIDAVSGLYVAAGHDWGTRGIVNELGLDMIFTSNEDKTVTIDTQVFEKENKHFLGSNLYTDSPAYNWILEYVGFGFFITNGNQYLSIDLNNNLVMSDTPREWIIVTAEGVMEQRLSEMAEATKETPVNATFLLKNPNFNRNDKRSDFWTVSEDCTNNNLNGGNNVNNCAESFHSIFTISQTVEGAPAGIYEMTAQGFYREDKVDGEITTVDLPVFFANEETATFPVMGELPDHDGSNGNSMSDASVEFAEGKYTIEPIQFTVAEDGQMTVGTRLEQSTNLWCIFDNFTLMYFGSGITDGIETVNKVSTKSNAIYNLRGQQVNNATKGIYIINGKKVVK
ncbi:MAG: FIVAR domain-containing protein [Prevotella sp.]|nr:FIVAR domain-containing protein [Prevotella sp.]